VAFIPHVLVRFLKGRAKHTPAYVQNLPPLPEIPPKARSASFFVFQRWRQCTLFPHNSPGPRRPQCLFRIPSTPVHGFFSRQTMRTAALLLSGLSFLQPCLPTALQNGFSSGCPPVHGAYSLECTWPFWVLLKRLLNSGFFSLQEKLPLSFPSLRTAPCLLSLRSTDTFFCRRFSFGSTALCFLLSVLVPLRRDLRAPPRNAPFLRWFTLNQCRFQFSFHGEIVVLRFCVAEV